MVYNALAKTSWYLLTHSLTFDAPFGSRPGVHAMPYYGRDDVGQPQTPDTDESVRVKSYFMDVFVSFGSLSSWQWARLQTYLPCCMLVCRRAGALDVLRCSLVTRLSSLPVTLSAPKTPPSSISSPATSPWYAATPRPPPLDPLSRSIRTVA